MKSKLHFAVVFASILAPIGCNSPPAEPAPAEQQSHSLSTASGAPPSTIAGYAHTLNKSKFKIGSAPSDQSDSGFLKVVGSDGVFAIDAINHSAAGVANGGAPTGTFTLSASAHEARVLSYFTTAGIPSDQIGGVHSTVSASGGGQSNDPTAGTTATSIRHTSIVERTIQGIPVVESHAWARFDDNDDVVAEDVYWPELPTAALVQAQAIAGYLQDSNRMADYLAKLPVEATAGQGRVVIRHSSMAEHGAFAAYGCYDVFMKGGEREIGFIRHFGADGAELRLPQESRQLPTTARQDRK
jgi:hypothetical protein